MATSDYEYLTCTKEYRKNQARIEREIQQELDEEFMSKQDYNNYHSKYLADKEKLESVYNSCVTAMEEYNEWDRKQKCIVSARRNQFYNDLAEEFQRNTRQAYIITSSKEAKDFISSLSKEERLILSNKQLIQRVSYNYYDALIDHSHINPYTRPEDSDHITINFTRNQYLKLVSAGLLLDFQFNEDK